MILPEPFKGVEVLYVDPLISDIRTGRPKRPFIRIKNQYGNKFYLSWENLQKVLSSIDYDVDKKRVRHHLIPLIKPKEQ